MTSAVWRKTIASEQERAPLTQQRMRGEWLEEHAPGLFGTPLLERAASLAYRVSLTAGFGDERVTMACRQAVAFAEAGVLAEPEQQQRIAEVLAFVNDQATRGLSGAVVADKVRALLEETGALW